MKTCLKKVTHIVTLIDKTFDHAVSVESGVDNAYAHIMQDIRTAQKSRHVTCGTTKKDDSNAHFL